MSYEELCERLNETGALWHRAIALGSSPERIKALKNAHDEAFEDLTAYLRDNGGDA